MFQLSENNLVDQQVVYTPVCHHINVLRMVLFLFVLTIGNLPHLLLFLCLSLFGDISTIRLQYLFLFIFFLFLFCSEVKIVQQWLNENYV